jgi:hypothetical protein
MKLLRVEEHRELLEETGCSDVRIIEERGKRMYLCHWKKHAMPLAHP